MDVEIINPFLSATLNVLETMAYTKATPGKPSIKPDRVSRGDVTVVCGLSGDETSGSFAISFTESAILHIVSNMFGEPFSTLDDEVQDAAGEITNMISGGARKRLAEKGLRFNMSLPTVVAGKGHEITHTTTGPIILLPFTMEAGDFFVEICMDV